MTTSNFHYKSSTFLLVFLLLMLLGGCSATKNLNQNISKQINQTENFSTGFTGFVLYDPTTKKTIFEHNSDKYFTPASNIKLFTFYAGLQTLEDSIPSMRYAIKNDSLIFKATGDPSLLNPDLPDSGLLEFLKSRNEQLFYLKPSYSEEKFGPGWAWDDYNYAFSAEKAAFPIYGNKLKVIFKENNPLPHTIPSSFENSIASEKDSMKKYRGIRRKLNSNHFTYIPKENKKNFEANVPFIYSEELFLELLSDTLKREIHSIKLLPQKWQLSSSYNGIATDTLYKKMLQKSDNFIAEQILLLASESIADTLKSDIAIEFIKKNHLQDLPDEPIWVDGSGLSRYNLITPRTIVKLLEKVQNEVDWERLTALLPAGGESGTLKSNFKAEYPYIFAKSGSMSNNYSLSGYLKTDNGKVLIFSFMNNNFTVSNQLLKKEIEQILLFIKDNY
ncbi:D-alanyl-D-alanine carboxypeptidase/D-alanyl-D-alanine endopeptidase [Autumnicola psychrophila]|uniref:D-alanyl-D-alanine carboxypeptidase/D-alanyl-D-alanine-endopeptidase n=1 Tax=Autumnicola psychrophila TaxID=3075592 RepID=A0ABU3DM41_9FLAO|nr:D-alanyl-D-alanine carboxypeptidase/D-alanyl-D-alanine-endopeptidase [Zunongwangia sp. F225]MDT0684776.1 D-alanyl-D-alanine carboxypeptidase/D-alanyl-D-alanine-endopeptidase [Zunongwangia sp. F225]